MEKYRWIISKVLSNYLAYFEPFKRSHSMLYIVNNQHSRKIFNMSNYESSHLISLTGGTYLETNFCMIMQLITAVIQISSYYKKKKEVHKDFQRSSECIKIKQKIDKCVSIIVLFISTKTFFRQWRYLILLNVCLQLSTKIRNVYKLIIVSFYDSQI
jgi:hypothetical protein